MPIRWEKNSTASYQINASGQAVINQQILDDSDILIAIFGNKIGTLTENKKSGTVEEIDYFSSQNKREIGIFFLNEDVPEHMIEERKMVIKYKQFLETNSKGLHAPYELDKVRQFLTREVNNLINEDKILNSIESSSQFKGEELDIFDEIEFDLDEQLLLIFIAEENLINLGSRWMAEETINRIQEWENLNNVNNYLSFRYEETLEKLSDKELIFPKEYTQYDNPRLYSIGQNIYKQLKASVINNEEQVKNIKNNSKLEKTNEDVEVENFELPF